MTGYRPPIAVHLLLLAAILFAVATAAAGASDFVEPWKRDDRALIVDAYEYNPIDWPQLVSDKRIVGFINKASDGLPPPYYCKGDEIELRLCKTLWRRHAVARELFQTRRTLARALGLKWGAYHLARPGNPEAQADNFLDFATPGPDDLMALDLEDNDPDKWMSLADAETFVTIIRQRTGRYPVLYTNGRTAQYIADNRDTLPILSRLPLWYARYKPEIGMHFPAGNWDSYALWQFSAQANCNARSCPYRVKGANNDIDVNVAAMDAEALRLAWPFGNLVDVVQPETPEMIASVPLPVSREAGLKGDVEIAYANVRFEPGSVQALAFAFLQAGNRYPHPAPAVAPAPAPPVAVGGVTTASTPGGGPPFPGVPVTDQPVAGPENAGPVLAYAETPAGSAPAIGPDTEPQAFRDTTLPSIDPVTTASVPPARAPIFPRQDYPIFLLRQSNDDGERFEDLFGAADGTSSADTSYPYGESLAVSHAPYRADVLLAAPFRAAAR